MPEPKNFYPFLTRSMLAWLRVELRTTRPRGLIKAAAGHLIQMSARIKRLGFISLNFAGIAFLGTGVVFPSIRAEGGIPGIWRTDRTLEKDSRVAKDRLY